MFYSLQIGIRVPAVFFVDPLKNRIIYEQISLDDDSSTRAPSAKHFLDKIRSESNSEKEFEVIIEFKNL